jgi:phosphate starvation-inducible PhoH-like protein
MKTFLLNPAFLLLSSFGIQQALKPANLWGINARNIYGIVSGKNKKHEDTENFDYIKSIPSSPIHSPKKNKKTNSFSPRTPNQKSFVELMRNDDVDILVAIGPAGTGKTMMACYAAVESLHKGKVNKIVVTRPVVSVDEEIGFLPGDLESKMSPWTRPIFDVLRETYSAKDITQMTEDGVIEIVPLGFMRGRTFKNTWIIADEMQNSSPTQMFMLATRIGECSKMIITGDLNQSDLNVHDNGLKQIYNKVRYTGNSGCVRYIELEKSDVQRSRAAKTILDIYEHSTPVYNDSIIMEEESPLYVYNDEDDDGIYSNEMEFFERLNETSIDSELHLQELASSSNANVDVDDTGVDMENANDIEEKMEVNISVDWVDLDNDAALIPLKHMKKIPKQWK